MIRSIRHTAAFVTISAALFLPGCATAPSAEIAPNGAYSSPQPDIAGRTLANLQEAYNGESNAAAKYGEYAKKADAEGFAGVARLFRAASFAEGVHMKNHATVIRSMGAEPIAEIKLPEIRSTPENLKDAITGESYERDTMYTEFMIEARRTGNKDALRSFNFAKIAEAEHARLYAAALAKLDQKNADSETYFVCRTCGWTTSDAGLRKCPVDFTGRENFEVIK